jgi:2-oxoglutarate ferredoxin oxidoreductase subunit delta
VEGPAINVAWCKGCGICVAFCPRKALRLVGEKSAVDFDRCVLCGLCELYCPDLAITVDPEAVRRRKASRSGKSRNPGAGSSLKTGLSRRKAEHEASDHKGISDEL